MKNKMMSIIFMLVMAITMTSCTNAVGTYVNTYDIPELIEESVKIAENNADGKEDSMDSQDNSGEDNGDISGADEEKPIIDSVLEESEEEAMADEPVAEESLEEIEEEQDDSAITEQAEVIEEPKVEKTSKDEAIAEETVKEEKKEEIIIPDSFDADFYASHNPDVVAVFGNSPEGLYKHYLNYGKKEGRSQNEAEETAKVASQQEQQKQPDQQQNPSQLVSASGQVFDYIIIDEKPQTDSLIYEVVCDTEMLNLINSYRTENGLSELSWNAGAEQIAKDRIKAIAEGGVLSHDAAGGPPAGFVAENLFKASGGGCSSQFIFDGYKSSPGHDTNMRNCSATSCVIATCNVYKELGGLRVNSGQWNIQIFF